MDNFVSSYISSVKKRSFKSKNFNYAQIIRQSFNFVYAGNVSISIEFTRGKYRLVCIGFTTDGEVTFFSKNRVCKFDYDSLYTAILAFHKLINIVTSSVDWFSEEYFDSCEFYNFANEELFL